MIDFNHKIIDVLRLAEQGLATKGALLVVIPLTIYILVTLTIYCRKGKGDEMKKMRKPGGDALKATLLETIKGLSGGMAGSALLA